MTAGLDSIMGQGARRFAASVARRRAAGALVGGEAVASHRLFEGGDVPPNVDLEENDAMHLSVSVRSPRARQIAEWVNAVLALKPDAARAALKDLTGFRLGLTRASTRRVGGSATLHVASCGPGFWRLQAASATALTDSRCRRIPEDVPDR